MRFAIDGQGAQSAGQGLGNLLGAVFNGGYVREQAAQQAAARAAQTYASQMQGRKYGAEADGLELTNQHRQAPIDESLPQHMQTLQKLFQWDSNNIEPLSKAMLNAQAATHRGNAVANPEMAPAIGQAYAAIEGRPLVTNVGNTGRTMNHFTGGMDVQDEVLAKLFGDVQSSDAAANNARAAASYASADNSRANAEFTRDRNAFFGETGSLPGARGSGEDATNAKTRNAIIAAVERDLMGADEVEIMAEVERRLARRGIGSSAQKPAGIPKAGTVEDGYRFKGGDPADPNNWEKI